MEEKTGGIVHSVWFQKNKQMRVGGGGETSERSNPQVNEDHICPFALTPAFYLLWRPDGVCMCVSV